ncbi:uncharacterized protein LOC111325329 isoform X1 [Stylophora pistillata]|uniref:uncharacterized protein LOC111325329 isoform X1 n=2 Tax=Stylophora pistillata TaxID=50429 RepID=UPI000C03D34C|nr:uncharacterized protein LOC111325329 isoform X1 [Stylophora pistillata]
MKRIDEAKARSSETVRRQETSDSGGLIENLLWKSTTDRNSECTNACMQPLVGVCGKVVARSGSLGLNDRKKPITGVTLRESLPHPSKLKKKRRKQSKHQPSVRQSQQGFDVMAHVAHLRRKQAEFNWLPSYEKDDISSSSDLVEEESFPPGSTGPQCVPSTPTLLSSESFELHRPPTSLNTKGRANMDLFNAYYQVPTGQSSIPSYAVARRERAVVQLQEEELHESPYDTRLIEVPNTDSFSPAMEQKSLTAWLNPQSSKLKRFHPIISEPPKEE